MRSRNVVSARENTLRTTSTAQRTPTSNCRREGEEEKREKIPTSHPIRLNDLSLPLTQKTNPNSRSSSALQEPGLRPRRRRPERKTCFLESNSPAECRRTYN
ncbi:hypothetical protein TNCV_790381 [Trichonephila clavipes]|nr:hypothetical protein TNCV_790381 [Trichonephila clavipes]